MNAKMARAAIGDDGFIADLPYVVWAAPKVVRASTDITYFLLPLLASAGIACWFLHYVPLIISEILLAPSEQVGHNCSSREEYVHDGNFPVLLLIAFFFSILHNRSGDAGNVGKSSGRRYLALLF